MKDLFSKIYRDKGPLGKWADQAEGYFVFPKLEGEINNRMKFQGREVIESALLTSGMYIGTLSQKGQIIKSVKWLKE